MAFHKNPFCGYHLDGGLCWFLAMAKIRRIGHDHQAPFWHFLLVGNHAETRGKNKLPLTQNTYILLFALNIMYALGAVDLRIHLAPKYNGYSTSAQSYDFYHNLTKLDNFIFTM